MSPTTRFFSRYLVPTFIGGTLFGLLVSSNVSAALKGSAIFRDVKPGSFYDDAIGRIKEKGLMSGISATQFDPEAPMTRGQMAVVLDRLVNGVTISSVSSVSSSRSSSSRSSSSSSSVSSSSSSSSSYATAGPQGSLRFTTPNYTVARAAGNMRIVVVRTGGTQGTATVQYSMSGGTAIPGTDFTKSSGTFTFVGTATSQILNVPILSSATPGRTIILTLSNPTGGAVLAPPSSTTVTILTDDGTAVSSSGGGTSSTSSVATNPNGTIVFSASEYAVAENGNSLTITVNRKDGTNGAVAVNYATSNGNASTSDFSATSGTLNFAAGEASKTFSVPVNNDTTVQGNRYFYLTLSNPTGGAGLGTPASAKATIMDDEVSGQFGSGSFKFSVESYDVSRSQGVAVITVTHIGGIVPASISYSTNGGSALPNTDYTPTSGTLNFAPGEVSKTFTIPVFTNTDTSTRSVNLLLTNPTNGVNLSTPSTAVVNLQS